MSATAHIDGTVSTGGREGGEVSEIQRRRLLLAVVEVVGGDGLERATVGGIAKRAGVSRRTFYELFEDREACLVAAVEQSHARIAAGMLAGYSAAGKWSERVRAALTALLGYLDSEPAVARLCFLETPKAGPEVVACRKRAIDVLTAAVDEGRMAPRSVEPPPLTAQGVVGGAVSVIQAHLLEPGDTPLTELVNPLMGMIVHPYLGAAAARRELDRTVPHKAPRTPSTGKDPFKDLPIRFTYRTARVLSSIASCSGASNRTIAGSSGIGDEGQMSRLLGRLEGCGLIENTGLGQPNGEPNAWQLTERGADVQEAISQQAARL